MVIQKMVHDNMRSLVRFGCYIRIGESTLSCPFPADTWMRVSDSMFDKDGQLKDFVGVFTFDGYMHSAGISMGDTHVFVPDCLFDHMFNTNEIKNIDMNKPGVFVRIMDPEASNESMRDASTVYKVLDTYQGSDSLFIQGIGQVCISPGAAIAVSYQEYVSHAHNARALPGVELDNWSELKKHDIVYFAGSKEGQHIVHHSWVFDNRWVKFGEPMTVFKADIDNGSIRFGVRKDEFGLSIDGNGGLCSGEGMLFLVERFQEKIDEEIDMVKRSGSRVITVSEIQVGDTITVKTRSHGDGIAAFVQHTPMVVVRIEYDDDEDTKRCKVYDGSKEFDMSISDEDCIICLVNRNPQTEDFDDLLDDDSDEDVFDPGVHSEEEDEDDAVKVKSFQVPVYIPVAIRCDDRFC